MRMDNDRIMLDAYRSWECCDESEHDDAQEDNDQFIDFDRMNDARF